MNRHSFLVLLKEYIMDWMYDGMKIQKEDYLLGKKVDKHFNEKADNGNSANSLCNIFNVMLIIVLCYYYLKSLF